MSKSNLAYKTNLAYKERFKEQPKKVSHIGHVKKKQIKNVKPAFYISLMILASLILCFYIANLAKGSVINFKINEKKKQLEIQNSETVRLNSVLEAKCSNCSDIEKYVKLNCNMKHRSINQVYYIAHTKTNKLEKQKNKTESLKGNENLLIKLKKCFQSFR